MNRHALVSRTAVWAVLYGALFAQSYRYANGAIFYGEYLHWTGLQATHLLILALAVTPLLRWFPTVRWIRWLAAMRRDFGVAVFGYAVAHTIAYLLHEPSLQDIISDSVTPELLTGWVALIIFVPLAITSNNYSVRNLGKRWKLLHRLVYVGALLTLAHWILTAFDPTSAYVYLAVVLSLLALRAVALSETSTQ